MGEPPARNAYREPTVWTWSLSETKVSLKKIRTNQKNTGLGHSEGEKPWEKGAGGMGKKKMQLLVITKEGSNKKRRKRSPMKKTSVGSVTERGQMLFVVRPKKIIRKKIRERGKKRKGKRKARYSESKGHLGEAEKDKKCVRKEEPPRHRVGAASK